MTALILCSIAALVLPWRHRDAAHGTAPALVAAAWVLVFWCTVVVYVPRWEAGGQVACMSSMRTDHASAGRHMEKALGASVCVALSVMCAGKCKRLCSRSVLAAAIFQAAQAIMALATDWHELRNPSPASVLAHAAVAVGIVGVYAVMVPVVVAFVSPNATATWWLWLSGAISRTWRVASAAFERLGLSRMSLRATSYLSLLGLVLLSAGASVIGFPLPPWIILAMTLWSGALSAAVGLPLPPWVILVMTLFSGALS